MSGGYLIPADVARAELIIRRSRFVSAVQAASSVADARAAIATARDSMPDANHHVYAFRVGFGNTVTEGMSDDGEPTGTAGPPTLAVLRGAGIGDIVIVTSRFFGGTKLGTGGLVRAYAEAAKQAIRSLKTELKVEKKTLGLEMPYAHYNIVRRLIDGHNGKIEEEVFEAQVLMIATFAVTDIDRFSADARERTAGLVSPVELQ
ncbi:MAG: YigZ family protein [Chloroflexi bacterium]|nr:YigZ family protein [Chloroflexota bacterium]